MIIVALAAWLFVAAWAFVGWFAAVLWTAGTRRHHPLAPRLEPGPVLVTTLTALGPLGLAGLLITFAGLGLARACYAAAERLVGGTS